MATQQRRTLLAAREAPRAAAEYASFLAARRKLLEETHGDGRPVLVLPGFVGSDRSTGALRGLLREGGYHVHAWRLGRNWGPTDAVLDGLRDRIAALLATHGERLTLIGHSLGGIYSREIARAAPDAIRQVITLGSPFRRPARAASVATPLFRALSPMHSDRAKVADPDQIRLPLSVPLTAIITRTDGVVPWEICLPEPGPRTETIEVRGSHSGLVHNPAAVAVIVDRLGRDEWTPFAERPRIGARIWVDAARVRDER